MADEKVYMLNALWFKKGAPKAIAFLRSRVRIDRDRSRVTRTREAQRNRQFPRPAIERNRW
jgi:hypothetical protein